MPALSHLFHLSPSEIWAMTHQEYDVYLEAAEAYANANHG